MFHRNFRRTATLLALATLSSLALAHGDVVPQAVDTTGLDPVGKEWLENNPYSGNAKAVQIGSSAYNQNCARCHGLEAVSGGIAPDLRRLDNDCASLTNAKKQQACLTDVNGYFLTTIRNGRTRNGAVYMPPFEGTFSQEAMWAIKSYLESRREKPLTK